MSTTDTSSQDAKEATRDDEPQQHGLDHLRAHVVPSSRAQEAALEQLVLWTLQSRLDPRLTNEYRRAVEVVPDLVARECRIMDFVRTESYDTTAAAERIARYWKMRKLVFGFDKWLSA